MKRLLLALVLAPALIAQGPAHDWRTIDLPHFRVHYPSEYEAWATRAAERLESTRAIVSREVGFTPPQTIDVIVMNPIAESNGSAWPLLDTPRMIFFTEPPGPDEQLGAFGHWIDLLSVHETAHLVHMLRPSRNPLVRALEKSVLPFNPITLRAPRWVLEGYATVIEGRVTGAGRPTSTMRALILRQWAEHGRLPAYGQLDSDRRFLGMSMAYLMGSAYLEWLERRAGPDSLRNLWARMTARHRRSFDEAFAGVFGDRPDRLYGIFVAELTASSMPRERELREGQLFQETTRASGDPAVSPDGRHIAVVLRPRDEPEELVIWSTGPPDEEEKKDRERLDKLLARDPEDVAPVRTTPLPRRPVHSLTMPDGGDIHAPRWTRDGKALIFAHRVPDGDGVLHFDLYRWDFKTVTRITHRADVRDADPLDETKAIAVRSRHGASQLVAVDLTTGALTPMDEASIDQVITHPRASPDGTRVAQVVHRGGRWSLLVDGQPVSLSGDPASPEWVTDDELVVTVLAGGYAELHRVRDGVATPITRTSGGAFDPAPSRDGRVFFMSLEPDGYVLRVCEDPQAEALRAASRQGEGTCVARNGSPSPDPSPHAPQPPPGRGEGTVSRQSALPHSIRGERVAPGGAYGLGRQEWSWLASTNYAPGQQTTELGVRLGDVIGRLDTLLLASFGDADGVALATAWRGWPVELHAHAYHADDDTGGELRAIWQRRFPRSSLTIEGGASHDLVFANAAFSTRQFVGAMRFAEAVRVEVDDEHYRAILAGSVRLGASRIAARYQHDGGATLTLGGLASSMLPRSAYALRVLDPALPVAIREGDEYDGWRIESTVPRFPVTAFYQRHELGASRISLAGAEVELRSDPFPILKLPGLDLTAGVARIIEGGGTNWWIGMRWRP